VGRSIPLGTRSPNQWPRPVQSSAEVPQFHQLLGSLGQRKRVESMKRLIAALGVGWGLIYATNHLLLPHAPTESKVAVQSEQTSTNRSINSWGPYLPHVKHPEPNNMAQTSLKSRQIREPAASEDELVQLSSGDIIDHAEAVALEERTLQVARVENPPTAAVRQHDGIQSSIQDLKPNSEVVALRNLQAARVENFPRSAAYQHDGSQSSLQDLKPNSQVVALEERTLRIAENPPTAAAREQEGVQSSAKDIKPKSEAIVSAERTLQAANRPAGTTSIAHVEHPPTLSRETKKPRSPVTAKARIAQATTDQNPGWRTGSERKHRGVGLFMFAPPGF
jgi:hypothetical protein